VLVLIIFAWLVSRHSSKLFALSDFRDEGNYVRMQMAVASLTAATATRETQTTQSELQKIVDAGPGALEIADGWRNHVLWVDDRPENNSHERQAFEALGLRFTLAQSTDQAFQTAL